MDIGKNNSFEEEEKKLPANKQAMAQTHTDTSNSESSGSNISKMATGTTDKKVGLGLITQAMCVGSELTLPEDRASFVVGQLMAFNPQDGIEGMLAAQMSGCHNMTMQLMRRAKEANSLELQERFLNGAAKLMRTFATQLESLDRHRGKLTSKVEVNNVNVNDGGQAIVGGVTGVGSSKLGNNG